MVELTEDEKKIVEAMKSLGARSEEKLRDADAIAKAAMMPKGKVANILIQLVNKKVLRRVAREKAAGYYIVDTTV
jgi:DNA-binding IclR family transcriptional regulator